MPGMNGWRSPADVTMPSDDRKTITVPAPTHERFVQLHEEIRPNDRAPHWVTVNRLIESYQEQE